MTDNNGYVRFKGLTLSILLIDLMMVCAPVSYAFYWILMLEAVAELKLIRPALSLIVKIFVIQQ